VPQCGGGGSEKEIGGKETNDGENLDFDGTGDERGWEDVVGDEKVENKCAQRSADKRV
jgi:hypothetical protein